jgi:hypothetical protein
VRIFSIAPTCGDIVGEIIVAVEIGSGVNVDGTVDDVRVGKTGEEVIAEAHPLIKTVANTNTRINDTIDLFIFLALLILECKESA